MITCDKCDFEIIEKNKPPIYIAHKIYNDTYYYHLDCVPDDVKKEIKKLYKIEADNESKIKCVDCQDTGEVSYFNGVDREYVSCSYCTKGYLSLVSGVLIRMKTRAEGMLGDILLLIREASNIKKGR